MAEILPAKLKRVGLSGPEKMFWDQMDKIGVVEAFIIRSPRDWFPDSYCYKVTRSDGTVKTGMVPWDMETFSKVSTIAKG